MLKKSACLLFCVLVAFCAVNSLRAQGTAFTYQGQLFSNGSLANGNYDLAFTVYDSSNLITGNVIVGPITNSAVAVTNGLFTTILDFGMGVFTGPSRWLQISVSVSGANNFTILSPRQLLTATPYAIFANSSSNLLGNLSATQLSGTLPASAFAGFTNTVALTNGANFFGGTFSGTFSGAFGGNGTNLMNLNASQLTGGTVADARLSTNVALLNTNQTFTGSNIFRGFNTLSGTNNFTGANAFTNLGNSFVGSFFGNGLVGWLVETGTTVQAVSDTGYVLTNSQTVTVTLPPSPNMTDIVRVSGAGAGGWKIAQNAGQSVLGSFSTFANSSWTPGSGTVGASWQAIASSADGSKLVAVSSSSFIYFSSDAGVTWTPTSTPGTTGWRAVASSADGTKWVAANTSIYTNSGTSWAGSGAPTGLNWSSLASSADGTELAATVLGGQIYTSTTSGSTWVKQTTGLPSSANWQAIASSSNGSNLVAAVFGGQIYTSSNSGASWTKQTAGLPSSANWQSVASSTDGSRLVAVIFGGGIYTSANSGATWTQQPNAPNANWQSIASSSDGGKLASVVTNGAVYISGDWGATWTQQANAPNNKSWSCITSSSDGSELAATVATASGAIYSSQSSSQSSTTSGTNGYITGVQGTAVELQYIGNGQFMPVSSFGTLRGN